MKNKMIFRVVSALLTLVMAMSSIACNQQKDEPPSNETSSSDTMVVTDDSATPDEKICYPKSNIETFRIIYPNKCNDSIISAAESIAQTIKSCYDVDVVVSSDLLRPGDAFYTEQEFEILVGTTNRDESAIFASSLRMNDYGYGCIGTKILIGGHTVASVLSAITNFNQNVVRGKLKSEYFFCSDWAKTTTLFYGVESFQLNGLNISQYRIVYPVNGKAFEEELAFKLYEAIIDVSGFVLPIVTDETPVDGTPELLVGITNRTPADPSMASHTGYVVSSEKNIALYGSTAYGTAQAVEGFATRMRAGVQGKTCTLEISQKEIFTKDADTVTSMSFNVLTSEMTADRIDRVIATILRSLPDTFGIQEGTTAWMSTFKERLGEYYDFIGTGTQSASKGNEFNTIFYAKERFDLVEGRTYWLTETPEVNSDLPGTLWPRTYTYVVLQDKVTRDRFMHLNTHLDNAGEDIRLQEANLILDFLKKYDDLPIILSGDLNAEATASSVQFWFNKGFIQPIDALHITDPAPTFSTKIIDFVLVTNDCLEITDYVVESEKIFGDYASDHRAIFIRFKFRDVEQIDHGWT